MRMVIILLATSFSCNEEARPPITAPGVEPEAAQDRVGTVGAERRVGTDVTDAEVEGTMFQDTTPVRQLDVYLDGFHIMKDDPNNQLEAHHYCRKQSDQFVQCVIYDGTTDVSNLVGVEYIISEVQFNQLPEDEKRYWHPHNYEILSGLLVAPGMLDASEDALMRDMMNSYGKTWHLWDTGFHGKPATSRLPLGEPMLAWSVNYDGELYPALLTQRDQRLDMRTAEVREERAELRSLAHPQKGVDALREKLPSRTGTVEGVRDLDGWAESPGAMQNGK